MSDEDVKTEYRVVRAKQRQLSELMLKILHKCPNFVEFGVEFKPDGLSEDEKLTLAMHGELIGYQNAFIHGVLGRNLITNYMERTPIEQRHPRIKILAKEEIELLFEEL